MNNRTTGIVVTVLAVLVCGLPGLICLCLGAVTAIAGLTGDPYISGSNMDSVGLLMGGLLILCLSVVLVAIPVVVGFLTLRNKPKTGGGEAVTIDAEAYELSERGEANEAEPPEEPIPPAI